MSSLHHRAKHVFLSLIERPAADRPVLLAEACHGDDDLRREVESLLAVYDEDQLQAEQSGATSDLAFEPGAVFAGRYRMVAMVGRGGMGTVWRAEDLVLKTPVALKLIDSADHNARDRILNEVRLARQITHPAVCRVFDVGEAGGLIFYTMELIRGDDLASLLRRVGRLPSEKVTHIASQLCAGLGAAHAQGVLHRDLKPANIVVDEEGYARITDFGIAILRSDSERHMLTGTPGYMAPEQRARGAELSERTDIYALGLVLYELLVGHHPFDGSNESPVPPSSVVPSVDRQLERLVMQCLSPQPRDRPSSAYEIAASLGTAERSADAGRETSIRNRRRVVPWLVGSAIVATGAVAMIWSAFFARGDERLTERDTVLIAEFDNSTEEAVFDGTLKVALAVALEQSPFLKVFPEDRARDTLRLMGRSPNERLTRSTAREVARREQLKALLSGSIATLGRKYVLSLEAVNAETGDVMAREQAVADGPEQVLTALRTATSKLRERLGESLASIQRFDVPLARATTSSLEALQAYSRALSDGREVLSAEAIPHLRRAIEVDPNFAMALALLSGVHANTGQLAQAPGFARKAFELRDRVSERERFFISWRYYRDGQRDVEKALDLARSWTATYPRDAFAFNAFGGALYSLGHVEQAVEPLRQALQLDPRSKTAYVNLASALLALGRYEDTRSILEDATSRRMDSIGTRANAYQLAFVQGDSTTMARQFEALVRAGEAHTAYAWSGLFAAFSGRMIAAHEQFRRGVQTSRQESLKERVAEGSGADAETHALVGQCSQARSEAAAALEYSHDIFTRERASRTLALCGAGTEALSLVRELETEFPDATLTIRGSLPITVAALALTRGDPRRVLELLEPVRAYDRAPVLDFWAPYLRGQAYLMLKNGSAAALEFQSIVSRRSKNPASMLYPLAHLGLARAAMLRNERQEARTAYEAFLSLWKDADSNLPVLQEARRQYSRLQ